MLLVAARVAVLAACVAVVITFRNTAAVSFGVAIGTLTSLSLAKRLTRPLGLRLRQWHLDRRRAAGD